MILAVVLGVFVEMQSTPNKNLGIASEKGDETSRNTETP
jgi:hypothetical protein